MNVFEEVTELERELAGVQDGDAQQRVRGALCSSARAASHDSTKGMRYPGAPPKKAPRLSAERRQRAVLVQPGGM